MKKFKVRHKKAGRGRPSKAMKEVEAYLNDPKVSGIIEEATRMQMRDMVVFGMVLPQTQEKIEKLLENIKDMK